MITAGNDLFARVSLLQSLVWVVRAENPMAYALGTTYTEFSVALNQQRATIFTLERATEIRDTIARLFPSARLEPATFEQWIQQEAEPRAGSAVQVPILPQVQVPVKYPHPIQEKSNDA